MDTINIGRDLDESFSFSCYELDSTVELIFSDDEDNKESYIEISLEQTQLECQAFDFDFLRISFSSVLPAVTEFPTQSAAHTLFLNEGQSLPLHNFNSNSDTESTLTLDSSWTGISSSDKSAPEISSSKHSSHSKMNKNSGIEFPAVNRKGNIFVWSRWKGYLGKDNARREPEPEENQQLEVKSQPPDNGELVRNSIASKITTAINVGIMKFSIKFKSVKLMSSLVSLVKPYQFTSPQLNRENNNRRTKDISHKQWRLKRPFNKWSVQRGTNKNPVGDREKSKLMEINVDAIKGIFEAVRRLSIVFKDKETKTYPNSVKTSPIHMGEKRSYTRDNSIHAAIAHCKRSFGETSDICL